MVDNITFKNNEIFVKDSTTFSKELLRKTFNKFGDILSIKYLNEHNEFSIQFKNRISVVNVLLYNKDTTKDENIETVLLLNPTNTIEINNHKLNVYSLIENAHNIDNNITIKQLDTNTKNNNILGNEADFHNFIKDYKSLAVQNLNKKKVLNKNISKNYLSSNVLNNYKKLSYSEKRNIKNKIHSLIGEANYLYLSNKLDEATIKLKEIIKYCPDLPEVFHLLSLIFEAQNKKGKSLSMLMLFAQVNKNDKELWLRCADLNEKYNNFNQASYCYSRILRICRDYKESEEYYIKRAMLKENLKDYKNAAFNYLKMYCYNSKFDLSTLDYSINCKNKSFEGKLYFKIVDESIVLYMFELFKKDNNINIILIIMFRLSTCFTISYINMTDSANININNKNSNYKLIDVTTKLDDVINLNENNRTYFNNLFKKYSEIKSVFIVNSKFNLIYNKTLNYYDFVYNICKHECFEIVKVIYKNEIIFYNNYIELIIEKLLQDANNKTLVKLKENINIMIIKLEFDYSIIELNNIYKECFVDNNKSNYNKYNDIFYNSLLILNKTIGIDKSFVNKLTEKLKDSVMDHVLFSETNKLVLSKHKFNNSLIDFNDFLSENNNYISGNNELNEFNKNLNIGNNNIFELFDNNSLSSNTSYNSFKENKQNNNTSNKIISVNNKVISNTFYNNYKSNVFTNTSINNKNNRFNNNNLLSNKRLKRLYNNISSISNLNTNNTTDNNNNEVCNNIYNKSFKSNIFSITIEDLDNVYTNIDNLKIKINSNTLNYVKLINLTNKESNNNISILENINILKTILEDECNLEDYKNILYVKNAVDLNNNELCNFSLNCNIDYKNTQHSKSANYDNLSLNSDAEFLNHFVYKKNSNYVNKTNVFNSNNFNLKNKYLKVKQITYKKLEDINSIVKFTSINNFIDIILKILIDYVFNHYLKEVELKLEPLNIILDICNISLNYPLIKEDKLAYIIILFVKSIVLNNNESISIKKELFLTIDNIFNFFNNNLKTTNIESNKYNIPKIDSSKFLSLEINMYNNKEVNEIFKQAIIKASKRIDFKDNIEIKFVLSQIYLKSGFYSNSLSLLINLLYKIEAKQYKLISSDNFLNDTEYLNSIINNKSLIFFYLSLVYLFMSFSKTCSSRINFFKISMYMFKCYVDNRKNINNIELQYNTGRYYQYIRYNKIALEKYNSVIYSYYINLQNNYNINNNICSSSLVYYNNNYYEILKNYSVYNSSLIMQKNGMYSKAHDFIVSNIII